MPKNFFGHCKVRNWPKTFLHWAENKEFTFQQFKKICYCEKRQWYEHYDFMLWLITRLWQLTLYAPISQNGQTHSNNWSAVADELFECVWPFCEAGALRKDIFCSNFKNEIFIKLQWIFMTLKNSHRYYKTSVILSHA